MLLSERPAPMLLNLFHPQLAQSSAYSLETQQPTYMMSAAGRFQPLMAAVRQRFGRDVSLLQVLGSSLQADV